jgi:hypothetical protein
MHNLKVPLTLIFLCVFWQSTSWWCNPRWKSPAAGGQTISCSERQKLTSSRQWHGSWHRLWLCISTRRAPCPLVPREIEFEQARTCTCEMPLLYSCDVAYNVLSLQVQSPKVDKRCVFWRPVLMARDLGLCPVSGRTDPLLKWKKGLPKTLKKREKEGKMKFANRCPYSTWRNDLGACP